MTKREIHEPKIVAQQAYIQWCKHWMLPIDNGRELSRVLTCLVLGEEPLQADLPWNTAELIFERFSGWPDGQQHHVQGAEANHSFPNRSLAFSRE